MPCAKIPDRIDETYWFVPELIDLPFFPTFTLPRGNRERSLPSSFSLFPTSRWVRFGESNSFAANQAKSKRQPVRLYSYCLAHAGS